MYDYNKELTEAVNAGQRALDSLYGAENELRKARNWGVVDILGGGLISSLIKRSKMENAQGYMEQARHDLNAFSRELGDLSMSGCMNIDTNDFLGFADWFFDSFAVDFMVQDRIVRAQSQVLEAINRVEYILNELNRQ